MEHTLIAVDLAKTVFEIAVSERPGVVTRRRRLRRAKFLDFFIQQQPATVVLEACGSAHHWGRKIGELGHRVVVLPPHPPSSKTPKRRSLTSSDLRLPKWLTRSVNSKNA